MSTMQHYAWYTLLIVMSFTISFNGIFAQEEVEAAEPAVSAGLMLIILGIGFGIILALGFAMNAQSRNENAAKEE